MYFGYILIDCLSIVATGMSLYLLLKLRHTTESLRMVQRRCARLDDLFHRQSIMTQATLKQVENLDLKFQETYETHTVSSSSQPETYKQALKMAEMGANRLELEETCELSPAEAELLINLQGYKKIKEYT